MRMSKIASLLAIALLSASLHAQNPPSGTLTASDFAGWTVPQGSSPANGQIIWTAPTICTVTSAGYTFPAFRVGTPITIVDANPAQTEVVIPTVVRVNQSNCSIQATMAYVHYSYYIKTGTGGLQEAIDYQTGTGGTVINVTPGFVAQGGITSMIVNANGNYAVSILDARTSTLVPYSWNGTNYVAASFSGSNVDVNGSSVSNPNFNDTTPATPANGTNVHWQDSGSSVSAYFEPTSTTSGTQVVIDTVNSTNGTGYTGTPTITLSGGTCTTPPTVQDFNNNGSIYFEILSVANHGNCTVAPTVTLGSDATGTGANLVLAIQSSTLQYTSNGISTQVVNDGSGLSAGSYNPVLDAPITHGLILASGNFALQPSIYTSVCPANGPILQYAATALTLFAPCSATDLILLAPGQSNTPLVSFSRLTGNSSRGTMLISDTTQPSTIDFDPAIPGTSRPMAEGFNVVTTGSGNLSTAGYQGGAGYSAPGTCALTGGNRTSGSADTCSVSLGGGGGLVVSVTANGIWAYPPMITISGASGGSGAFLTYYLALTGSLTITGSNFLTPDGMWHWNTARVPAGEPSTANDIGELSSSGFEFGGGVTISSSTVVPQVGTPTVGHASCIKSAGPPVVIGYCSSVVASDGTCTCN
jgi:hypothetical protein